MKKNILIITCLATTFAHGMEIIPKTWSIISGTTTINLTRGTLSQANGKTDVMVVGRAQQKTLQVSKLGDNLKVGQINYSADCILYEKSKEDESASDDDTYKSFISSTNNKKKLWEKAQKKYICQSLMTIIEPRIQIEHYCNENDQDIEGFLYCTERQNTIRQDRSSYHEFLESKAIEEASKDLITCYLTALNEGFKTSQKSIALSALGTEVGFPREEATPLAVATILQFIKDFPTAYDHIELFVKKRSEFELYKNILQQYAEKK